MNTRVVVFAGAGLVGVSTAATSAVSLYRLAQLCGIEGPLAAALPIALDAGAGVAALVWITEKGQLREWGRSLAIAALIASIAGNAVQHAITSGLLDVTLPLVLIVGACIPACLWAVIHMAALMVKPDRKVPGRTSDSRKATYTGSDANRRQAPTRTVAEAVTEQAMQAAHPAPPADSDEGLSKRDVGLAFIRDNPNAKAAEVQIAAGVSKAESYRILALAKEAAS